MIEKNPLTKNELISELTKSSHGKLTAYVPVGRKAAKHEAEFLGHLIAWNRHKGAIRDTKVALPVLALTERTDADLTENALAHLATLDPRNLVRGLRFAKEIGTAGSNRNIRRVVERYIRARETNWAWWERTAVQHRTSLKELYTLCHVKPSTLANDILFHRKYPKGTVFDLIRGMKTMSDTEAAGYIVERKIPFLIAAGALGERMSNPELLLALVTRMTPTELVTNMKFLEKHGVRTVPALRAALEEKLEKTAKTGRQTLKTTKAVEAVADAGLKQKLEAVQEKQLDRRAMQGDWAVLVDKSGSMSAALTVGIEISALLARLAAGKVHVVLFDVLPRYRDATGLSLADIKKALARVRADGGTSIGVALDYLVQKKVAVDGIVIVSDGGENTAPRFCDVYRTYSVVVGKKVPVYFYWLPGEDSSLFKSTNELNIFDIRSGTDYHALPNLVQTMRTNRYSLVDEIMEVPLLTVEKALREKGAE